MVEKDFVFPHNTKVGQIYQGGRIFLPHMIKDVHTLESVEI